LPYRASSARYTSAIAIFETVAAVARKNSYSVDEARAIVARFLSLAEVTLVRGNHDLHAGDPPPALGIAAVGEPYLLAPFAFCHHPDLAGAAGAHYVLAGHVHPVFHLVARRDALRLPCFLLGAQRAVLPSFGAFTGGHAVRPEVGERLYLVAGDVVLAHANLTVGR
jgi:metallophosphoesterase superfamily enzyme